jgi:hypothetical protein
MDEVNHFIVHLSFDISFFIIVKNEVISFLWIRPEPFCLVSVAFGRAFPGRWSGSYSGVQLKRFPFGPCPCYNKRRKENIRNQDKL